jgi:hypothetical protein
MPQASQSSETLARVPVQRSVDPGSSATPIGGDPPISEQSAILVKMAAELKAEVAKTNKDTLSMLVVRKAEAIERLAHSVREKMKRASQTN